jgi:hypothetical protein
MERVREVDLPDSIRAEREGVDFLMQDCAATNEAGFLLVEGET